MLWNAGRAHRGESWTVTLLRLLSSVWHCQFVIWAAGPAMSLSFLTCKIGGITSVSLGCDKESLRWRMSST